MTSPKDQEQGKDICTPNKHTTGSSSQYNKGRKGNKGILIRNKRD